MYLNNFNCIGTESNLLTCGNSGLNNVVGCRGHLDDAGVRCAQSKHFYYIIFDFLKFFLLLF